MVNDLNISDDNSSYKSCCNSCNHCDECCDCYECGCGCVCDNQDHQNCQCSCKFYFTNTENTYKEILVLHKLKSGQRIRNVNNQIFTETRWTPLRFFSRDSRWNTLKDLKRLRDVYGNDNITINNAVETLCSSTYKNDKKWKTEAKKIFRV